MLLRPRRHRFRSGSNTACEPLERRRLLSAGDIDPSFGQGGWAPVQNPDYLVPVPSSPQAVAFQPDGKMLVAGTAGGRVAVARYNTDGSLDPTFDGRALPVDDANGNPVDVADLAVGPDGKIVIGGTRSSTFFFARVNPDGSPDVTFDGDGYVTTRFAVSPLRHLAVQADGKVLGTGGSQDSLLVRLNVDGSLDTSFNGSGVFGGNLAGGVFTNYPDYFSAVSVGPGGSVLVAGVTLHPSGRKITFAVLNPDGSGAGGAAIQDDVIPGPFDALTALSDGGFMAASATGSSLVLARFNADGTPDTTFGDAGRVRKFGGFDLGNIDIYSAQFMPDGRLVATGEGSTVTGDKELGVVRFNPDGTLDTSLAGKGWMTIDAAPADDRGVDVAVTPAGEIAVASRGLTQAGASGTSRFYAARVRPDGTPDARFGAGGVVNTTFMIPARVALKAVTPAPGGKVVSVGRTETAGQQVYVERRNLDGTLDPTFGGGDGWQFFDLGAGATAVSAGYAAKVFADGSVLVAGTVGDRRFMLMRLKPDGTPDTSFGGGAGVSTTGDIDFISSADLAFEPDGSAVVAGLLNGFGPASFGVVRFLPDGTLDAGFGAGGVVTAQPGGDGLGFGGVAVTPEGRIVVAGAAKDGAKPADPYRPVLLRLLPDGSRDASFGDNGVVVDDPTGLGGSTFDVLVDGDGKIVIAGSFAVPQEGSSYPRYEMGAARYLSDGTRDPSFDGDGWRVVNADAPSGEADRVLRQPDGKLVLVGRGPAADGGQPGVLIARLNPDGSLDGSFGNGGVATGRYGAEATFTTDAALAADGRVLVSASLSFGALSFIARFLGDGAVPPAQVVARHAFYNHSAFDGNDAAVTAADEDAIAADKQPRLPGQAGGSANVTGYARGLNGIMVDVADLRSAALGPTDFAVRSGRDADPSTWAPGPAPSVVTVRLGAGVGGSDRVTLVWPDFDPRSDATNLAVANGWLEVTVRAGANTGLAAPDVFAFGSLIGESGDTGSPLRVTALDVAATKRALGIADAPVTAATDFNRDGRINALDVAVVKANLARSLPRPVMPTSVVMALTVERLWQEDAPLC